MNRLEGKVAIITGGISGIGAATAELFCVEGAQVVLADLSEEKGTEFVQKLKEQGYDATFVKTDVTDEAQVEALVAKAVETYGRLDIMFANAGIGVDGLLHELSLADWNKTIDVNLTAVFLCNKHAVKQMLEQGDGGSIINTGSVHSFVGQKMITAYPASKGGVLLLTKTGALNYSDENIRINTVCPGYIETPLLGEDEEQRKYYESLEPMCRLGKPAEVAEVVLFLASDESSFVSGSAVSVDGGYLSR